MFSFKDRVRLAWRILRANTSCNSLRYAQDELLRAFPPDADDSDMPGWNDAMRLQAMEVLTVFAVQGNSGGSAMVAIPTIERLMRQEPLAPLTGEPDEWNQVANDMWQNRRCSHVFKDSEDGPAYDINGYVFVEPSGAAFTNHNSRKGIAFPYTPTEPIRVRVDSEGVPLLRKYREQFGFPTDGAIDPPADVLRDAGKTFANYHLYFDAKIEPVLEYTTDAEARRKISERSEMAQRAEEFHIMAERCQKAAEEAQAGPQQNSIQLTSAEIQSGLDRVRWAEGLIRQLPENHDGRNSWLLNYGTDEAEAEREDNADLLPLALLADAVKGGALEQSENEPNHRHPFGVFAVKVTFDEPKPAENLFKLLEAAKVAGERA